MNARPRLLYSEEQRLDQPWLWAIVAGIALLGWWAFFQQIVLGRPFGNNPGPDWSVILLWVTCGIVAPLGLARVRLRTEVWSDRLELRMRPLATRQILPNQVAAARPRTYNPIREYGGWGLKGWPFSNKRAWSMSGDQGVELVLVSGEIVMIGSQTPLPLAAAIREMVEGPAEPPTPRLG